MDSKTSRLGFWDFGLGSRDFGTGFRDFEALNPRLRAGFEIRGWIPGLRGGIPRLVGWNPRLGDEFRDLVSGFQIRRLKRQLKRNGGTVEKKRRENQIWDFSGLDSKTSKLGFWDFGLGFRDFGTGFRDFRALNPRLQAGFEIRGWLPGLRCGIPRLVGWNPRLGEQAGLQDV